jgi:hypothetical protein
MIITLDPAARTRRLVGPGPAPSPRLGAALLGAALALTFGAAPRAAHAQEEGGESGVVYQKKTIVNFDEDTIDGDLTRPDAAYVESRKRVRHSNLIRIREDFREKILGSVNGL